MGIYTQITPQWLRDTFLLGVDLTLDDGSAYPDVVYTQSINAAVRHVENDLGISIDPFSVTQEGHDAERQNKYSYWPFHLDYRPVLSVEKARIKFGSFQAVDVPVSWIKTTSSTHGQLHLIPSEEDLGSYFFRAGVPLMGGFGVYESREYVPSYFEFDYTAGFDERTGTSIIPAGQTSLDIVFDSRLLLPYIVTVPTTVTVKKRGQAGFTLSLPAPLGADLSVEWVADTLPADLRQAVGIKSATMLLLHIAGDLIIGAGIPSQALSIDGVSQSVGTTSSAMYSGYSSRAENLDKQYKLLIGALRAQYKILQFGVV